MWKCIVTILLFAIMVATCHATARPCLTKDPPGATYVNNGTGIGSTITYTCDDGYSRLSGDLVRTCQQNGELSGTIIVCAGDGGWTEWSGYGTKSCPEACGSANITRSRACTNPVPLNGADCVGDNSETISYKVECSAADNNEQTSFLLLPHLIYLITIGIFLTGGCMFLE